MVIILEKLKETFSSLRWRMVATYFVIIAVAITMISVYISNSMENYLTEQSKIRALTQANVLSGYIAQYKDLSEESLTFLIKQLQMPSDSRIIMTDGDAKITFDSKESGSLKGKILLEPLIMAALSGANQSGEGRDSEGSLIINAAVPLNDGKNIRGAVYLQLSGSDVDEYVGMMKASLAAFVLFICILAGMASFAMAWVIARPIRDLTARLQGITEKDEEYKIEGGGHGEIGRLVDSFNKMTQKIQKQEEKRQEFVSNASHELKTPLSSIKLISDSLLQTPDAPREMVEEFLRDMNIEVDRLTRVVNKLLTLTKLDSHASVSRMEFAVMDISEVAASTVKALRPLAEGKKIDLTYASNAAIYSRAERDRLWEAIYNLVDNSIKYTPEGGRVRVTLQRDGNLAVLTVKDTGIGIAADEIYKIFDRFYRVDKARARETGGTGLGLSIALGAVELHGGNIQVESEEGVGSKFQVTIPITLK